MPTLFFNVHDGVDITDEEGTDVADLDTARRMAIRYAGALLEESAERLRFGEGWHMEVADAQGGIVFRLDVRMGAPTAEARRRFEAARA